MLASGAHVTPTAHLASSGPARRGRKWRAPTLNPSPDSNRAVPVPVYCELRHSTPTQDFCSHAARSQGGEKADSRRGAFTLSTLVISNIGSATMAWTWKGFWGDDPVYRFNCGQNFFHAGRSKVSCDWWRPGHVTTVRTSDWSDLTRRRSGSG